MGSLSTSVQVLPTKLAGFVAGAGVVTAADSILSAFDKVAANASSGFVAGASTTGDVFPSGERLGFGPDANVTNTVLGTTALNVNAGGTNNVAIGNTALKANTTGSSNVAIGSNALPINTTGIQSVAVGAGALAASTTSGPNTAVGYLALTTLGGGLSGNTAIGNKTLQSCTTVNNTAVGDNALNSDVLGTANVAVGASALKSNNAGNSHTAVGYEAMLSSTASISSVAIGYSALGLSTAGNENVAVGANALANLTTGANNIGLGYHAQTLGAADSNSIVIGYNATGLGSGTTVLGMAAITRTLIFGTVESPGFIVAALPAAGIAGRRTWVSDAAAPVFGAALVGGGAVVCPAFDTGTAWVAG